MKYLGNTFDGSILEQVSAQCYCATESCERFFCITN